MAHTKLREEAVSLRQQGYTYGQIKRTIGISKSTLSGWLSNLPLTHEQIELISKTRFCRKDYLKI